MSTKTIPTVVRLRTETGRMKKYVQIEGDRALDPYEDSYFCEYKERQDDEIDKIIARSNGDPTKVMQGWYNHVSPNLQKRRGVHLVSGQIQRAAGLPVRQVYLFFKKVYQIETDGRVTKNLL